MYAETCADPVVARDAFAVEFAAKYPNEVPRRQARRA
jgi:hypothetical protein